MSVQTEARRTFFRVPIKNFGKLEREIERLSKRSQKAGGWQIELTRFGTLEGKDGQPDCYEVFLDAPDVRLEGHRFIARLDHSQETGNIIRMLPNLDLTELPAIYRSVEPKCDHCRINRMRRDTFILQNEAGDLIQLGSTCMSDFFKTDPRAIMKLAEIIGYARESAVAAESMDFTHTGKLTLRDLRYLPLEDYLTHCAAAMRQTRTLRGYGNGFVSSRFGFDSTKMTALRSMLGVINAETAEILDEDHATVAEAMGWVEKLSERRDAGENLSQFEHNLLVVGEATVIEGRACGIAAAIVGCYKRAMTATVAAKPVAAPAINVGDMTGILALFNRSLIKYPKITISFPETGEIVLSKASSAAQHPGTINVCSTGGYGNSIWYGRIHLDGRFERTRNPKVTMPEGFERALLAFAADPAGVAAVYGARSGNCCFCHIRLTDQRSALVGYGRTCAKNYGLPYPTIKAMTASKKDALNRLAA